MAENHKMYELDPHILLSDLRLRPTLFLKYFPLVALQKFLTLFIFIVNYFINVIAEALYFYLKYLFIIFNREYIKNSGAETNSFLSSLIANLRGNFHLLVFRDINYTKIRLVEVHIKSPCKVINW